MFSLIKGKKSATLKTRVRKFWDWYCGVADRFHKEIDARRAPTLQPEVSAKIDELFPGFAWEFSAGKQKGNHAFTLTGEGVLHRQLIARYWLSQAPQISGWDFYAARQSGDIGNITIEIGGREFKPLEFWVTPQVDPEDEKIDINIWHPMFDTLPERDRWTVTYLFLDEALGELGTGHWIGQIDLGDKKLADAIPLRELPQYTKQIETTNDWRKYPPGESFTGYSFEEPHEDFPRGDVIAGSTSNIKLLNEYLGSKGEMDDPLAETGSDYVYVALDSAILPKGNESHARGEIEDELEQALSQSDCGYVLGGAYGIAQSYIDLMIFDGDASLKIVQDVLKRRKLPSGTSINFFAKDKRDHRIVIR